MLAFTLKEIVGLIPEVLPLVKSASLEDEFPVDSRSSCIASALRVEYAKRVRHEDIDFNNLEKVAYAVDAYGVSDLVNELAEKMSKGVMVKAASASFTKSLDEYREAVLSALGDSGVDGFEKVASFAEEAADACASAGEPLGEYVSRYSGNMHLSKEAALVSLHNRYFLTKNTGFAKLAAVFANAPEVLRPGPQVRAFCKAVAGLDKSANLAVRGFDIYKEILITKEAAMAIRVRIGKEEFPIERVMKLNQGTLTGYLGADAAKEISSGDPMTVKAVVESLPADLQEMLLRVLKSC